MYVTLNMNPAAYDSKLQGFPAIPRFAISWSDVVGLCPEINCCVRQPKCYDWLVYIEHSSRERMSADVGLENSPG